MPPLPVAARRSTTERLTSRLRAALSEPIHQLQLSLALLGILVAAGTLGYAFLPLAERPIEIIDALYMTVITLTTVGFGEIAPLNPAGEVFTIVLVLGGVGTAAWAVSNAAEVMLGQTFWVSMQRRRMKELVMELSDHYIVCGYGRLGRQIVRDLTARGERFVVVDWSSDLEESLLEERIPHLIADATQEESLREAGVQQARGLVSALDSDANNVLTVLTARELNPRLLVVSRANTESVESKLRRAGADRVVTPESIGGHRLSLALLRPAVHDFFGRVFNVGVQPDVDIGQIMIPDATSAAGSADGAPGMRPMRDAIQVPWVGSPAGVRGSTLPSDSGVPPPGAVSGSSIGASGGSSSTGTPATTTIRSTDRCISAFVSSMARRAPSVSLSRSETAAALSCRINEMNRSPSSRSARYVRSFGRILPASRHTPPSTSSRPTTTRTSCVCNEMAKRTPLRTRIIPATGTVNRMALRNVRMSPPVQRSGMMTHTGPAPSLLCRGVTTGKRYRAGRVRE